MELLEGETLKKRIGGKPVSVDTLLDWAVQVTEGLDAAHARGVVHRDLKPANLFITNGGQAKILDFGLAKLRSERKTTLAGASDNTMTAVQTDPGSMMGPPAYMSPEQARGDQLDARSDLFSLGVVLYEMATGKLPFQGPSAATIIASVLRDSPQPPAQLNPELPAELVRLIEKVLEKDPDTRYQTAADLRGDLKRIKRDLDSGRLTATISSLPRRVPVSWRPHRVGWLLAAGAAGILVAAIAIFLLRRPPPPRILSTIQLTRDRREKAAPFLTDGSRLYFNTGSHLSPQPYQVSTEGGESVPLSMQLPNALVMDISPDNSQLLVGSFGYNPYAYNSATLWMAPVLGGSPKRVGDLVVGAAAWSPDGQEFVFTREREKELDIARIDGTGIRKLASVSGIPSSPRWSPDGKRIRFTLEPIPSTDWSRFTTQMPASTLWEVSTDGSGLHALFAGWSDPQCCGSWTSDGRYFVFQMARKDITTIWAMRERAGFFQSNSRHAVQLTTGPMSTYGPLPSIDGKRLFVGARQTRIELVRYDLKAKEFISFLSGTSAEGVDFSRDGEWVTYVSYPERTLWRSTVNGEQRLELTTPPFQASLPRWSPDRKRIAFMGNYPGAAESIFILGADGGTPQQLTKGGNCGDPTWSPDGNSLAFGGYPLDWREAPRNMVLQTLNLSTHETTTLPGSEGLWSPRWSPDGRYLAALSTDTQTLLLFDFRSRRWTELAQANIGYPTWSSDSQYIYFDTVGNDSAFYRVRVRDRKLEQIVGLKGIPRKVGAFGPWTGLTPDGSPLIARDASFDEIYALDWQAP
jgi:serine/threonine protein kinase